MNRFLVVVCLGLLGGSASHAAEPDTLAELRQRVDRVASTTEKAEIEKLRQELFTVIQRVPETASVGVGLLWKLPPRAPQPPEAPLFPFDATTAQRYQKAYAEWAGLPLDWRSPTGEWFILVPPGTFPIGSPPSEAGHVTGAYDETSTRVTLTHPFYLSKYETTVGQFKKFVQATKHVTDGEKSDGGHAHDERAEWKHRAGTSRRKPGFAGPYTQEDTHAVVHVSFNDVQAYLRWMTQQAPLERGWTFTLPTEAQWEWGCRGGSATRFWWGSDIDTTGKVANVGDRSLKKAQPLWPRTIWEMDDGHAFIAPVGSYRANAWGLHDMIGNVWEFCSTHGGAYPRGAVTDLGHLDPKRGFATRGGGWSNITADVRCATRSADPPTFCHSNLGFRAAVFLPPRPGRALTLFDFEDEKSLKSWSSVPPVEGAPKEPAVTIQGTNLGATSGKQSLQLTFAGGTWPGVSCTALPADWSAWHTFKADVTVTRPCVVGFTVLQEKSQRGGDWDGAVSRWTRTAFLVPGRNTVTGVLHPPNDYALHPKWGKVVRCEIFLYRPADGETIQVDHIRLLADREPQHVEPTAFKVLGTDLTVANVQELGKKYKEQWKKPEERTLDQVETAFRRRYDELKRTHPKAVLAVLRDGEKGYDPAQPERIYHGWKDAYWSSHGPDGMTRERALNTGSAAGHEVFMRHRSPLLRVDLASIPKGAKILAAQLLVVRASDQVVKEHNPGKPNMWVVEPCNRPWQETEVNAYEYARGKFWNTIGGMHWSDDADFLPYYLAHGPSQGKVNVWDFTAAVRFWTDGKQENHGFMLHGDAGDWLVRAHSREAKAIKDRPAVLVIYEP